MKIVKSVVAVVLILSFVPVVAHDFAIALLYGGGGDSQEAVDAGPISSALELDDSDNYVVSLQYRVKPELAFSLDYSVNQHDLDAFVPFPASGDLSIETLSLNAQYRLDDAQLSPYMGAGLGVGRIDSDARAGMLDIEDNGNFVMFNLFAGAQYVLHKNFAIQAELRFQHAVDAELELAPGLATDFDYDNLAVMVGAKFSF